ncbi:MAG: hypothetical protein M0O93_04935 [Bacteroidales bacterium]|nr:hypothetical protein [Bacteroidales bacterium]
MSIKYVAVERMISVGLNPGIKFLARPVKKETISFDQIADRVQSHSSLTKADVYASFMQSLEEVTEELMEGNPVELGDYGIIYPVFSAKAMDTLEEVDASTISSPTLRFLFSNMLRKKMKTVDVVLDKSKDIKGIQ